MWSHAEISSLLSERVKEAEEETLAQLFSHYFGVEESGNVKPHQVDC